jgi:hypothetical protein
MPTMEPNPHLDALFPVEPFSPHLPDDVLAGSTWSPAVIRPSDSAEITRETQDTYLLRIATSGLEHESASALGVAFTQIEELKRSDPEFEVAVEEAKSLYQERLQRTVASRAIYGWEEPVYHQGEICGYILKRDHKLLELEARRTNPAYSTHSAKHDLPVGDHGVLVAPDLSMTGADWEREFSQTD